MNFNKKDIVFGWYKTDGSTFLDRYIVPYRYMGTWKIKAAFYHTIEDVLLTPFSESITRKQKILSAKAGAIIECGSLSRDSMLILKRLSQEEIDTLVQLSDNSNELSNIRSKIYEQTKDLQERLREKEKNQRLLLKKYRHLVVVKD